MQLYPIVLIGVLLMADGGLGLSVEALGPAAGPVTAMALVPVALILGLLAAGIAWCRRRLAIGADSPGAVMAAERMARYARWLLLVHFAVIVLALGWLDVVRGAVGDLVLVDEVLAILPTVAGIVATWWLYHPIERRVRDTLLVRRLDMGRPVFPTPGRGRYVLNQVRLQILFLLVPILLILGVAEAIGEGLAHWGQTSWAAPAGDLATAAAALAIVVTAPLLVRLLLDVEPLAAGPLRDDLLGVCRDHRVRVRGLLVWNTHGTMINAAVMGLLGRLRYVLVTDALLESMSGRELEAVMAHEIAHVRCRHMPWLALAMLAAVVPVLAAVAAVQSRVEALAFGDPVWAGVAGAGVALCGGAVVIAGFGWVSRRFERQADAFAARHLSGPRGTAISPEAAGTVSRVLDTIARISAVPPDRPSWRHGSIAWRQAHLASLAGTPARTMPIDRQVRWIKRAVIVILLLCLAGAAITL